MQQILASTPVSASVPVVIEWNSPPGNLFPEIVTAEVPGYPFVARRGGITGVVELKLDVKAGRVVDVHVLSGERILSVDAVENVEKWRFASDVETSLHTRIIYELERREAGANANARVEMHLPTFTRVIGARDDW